MEKTESKKEYTFKERQAITQIRNLIGDAMRKEITDSVLLKFLRSKNFNIRKSERFVRAYLNMLTSFQIDHLEKVWEKPEILEKYEFTGELGFAKNGTPIRYIAMGRGDFIGYMCSMDPFDIGKYSSQYLERDLKKGRENSIKFGREINDITYIIDMEEFSLRQILSHGVVELGLDLFRIVQDYYPEVWNRVLIVNAPGYFSIAFNLFKPIFKRNLLQRIEVASKDNVAELLLKYIDKDVLPKFLGGNRVDSNGNPMCREFISFGGTVPEKFYVRNCKPLLSPGDPDVTDVWLYPKCSYNIIAIVTEPNSLIKMQLRGEGGSLVSCVLYKAFGTDSDQLQLPATDEYLDEYSENFDYEIISPSAHCQMHETQTDNHLLAARPGIYIIKFYNSHNWLSSRRLIYRVKVIPPLPS